MPTWWRRALGIVVGALGICLTSAARPLRAGAQSIAAVRVGATSLAAPWSTAQLTLPRSDR